MSRLTVESVKVGDFISEKLVTDTVAWVVVKKTKKTLTVVPAVRTGHTFAPQSNGVPTLGVWSAVAAPESTVLYSRVLVETKNGIRLNSWSTAHKTRVIEFEDGVSRPAEFTDWSY